eukprot:jgi/Chlat1/405/Chrsp10S01505
MAAARAAARRSSSSSSTCRLLVGLLLSLLVLGAAAVSEGHAGRQPGQLLAAEEAAAAGSSADSPPCFDKSGWTSMAKWSDLTIAIAYFSLPMELVYFARKSSDVPFRWLFLLFGAFIVLCGLTHLITLFLYTTWSHTVRNTLAITKLVTGIVSVFTAIALGKTLPELVSVEARQVFLQNQAEALLKEVGQMRVSEWHGRMERVITQRMRASLDRTQVVATTLQELARALALREAAIWFPADDGKAAGKKAGVSVGGGGYVRQSRIGPTSGPVTDNLTTVKASNHAVRNILNHSYATLIPPQDTAEMSSCVGGFHVGVRFPLPQLGVNAKQHHHIHHQNHSRLHQQRQVAISSQMGGDIESRHPQTRHRPRQGRASIGAISATAAHIQDIHRLTAKPRRVNTTPDMWSVLYSSTTTPNTSVESVDKSGGSFDGNSDVLPEQEFERFGILTLVIEVVADQLAVALSHAAVFEMAEDTLKALTEQNAALEVCLVMRSMCMWTMLSLRLQTLTPLKQVARREAEAATRARTEFLTVMNHELRTPMHAIIALTSLLVESPGLTQDQRTLVETVRRSGESLSALINDVLDFSRLENNRIELDTAPFHLYDAFHHTVAQCKPMLADKPVALYLTIEDDVPNVVTGDRTRFVQVVTNIVSNATKFTSVGEICIHVSVDSGPRAMSLSRVGPPHRFHRHGQLHIGDIGDEERNSDISINSPCSLLPPPTAVIDPVQPVSAVSRAIARRNADNGTAAADQATYIRVEVKDTGVGIDPDNISKLFNNFVQADSATTRRFGGTGLGLAISKRFVQLMGGEIWMESGGVGRGTLVQFVVRLERSQLHDATSLPSDITSPASSISSLSSPVADSSGAIVAEQPSKLVDENNAQKECEGDNADISTRGSTSSMSQALEISPTRQSSASAMARCFPSSPRLEGLTVLACDDNVVNQMVTRRLLERLGCRCLVVGSGRDCLDVLHNPTHGYRVLLLDLCMPLMDGFEVAKRMTEMCEDGSLVDRPLVVALTANADLDTRQRCIHAGMDAFIGKPIPLDALRDTLRSILKFGGA